MIFNWIKKSFWSGTYYLKDGAHILWEFDGNETLVQHPYNELHRVCITCQQAVLKTVGFNVDLKFKVTDERPEKPVAQVPLGSQSHLVVCEGCPSKPLVQVHLAWGSRTPQNDTGFKMGTITAQSGECFDVINHSKWKPSESFIEAKSPTNFVKLQAKKSVETSLDMSNKVTAAILLTPLMSMWRSGLFRTG